MVRVGSEHSVYFKRQSCQFRLHANYGMSRLVLYYPFLLNNLFCNFYTNTKLLKLSLAYIITKKQFTEAAEVVFQTSHVSLTPACPDNIFSYY